MQMAGGQQLYSSSYVPSEYVNNAWLRLGTVLRNTRGRAGRGWVQVCFFLVLQVKLVTAIFYNLIDSGVSVFFLFSFVRSKVAAIFYFLYISSSFFFVLLARQKIVIIR